MNRKNCLRYAQGLALGLVVLAAATPSFAQNNLVALKATATMPNGVVIPMWGYFADTGQPCTAVPAWGLGPELAAAPGGTLTITLRNCLSEDISIFIPGQKKVTAPVTFTDGQSRTRVSSFDAVTAKNGGTRTYTWNGVRAGTFLYQSGTHPQKQVQMGLYGVLTVGSYSYPAEQSVVFSEIDPALHAAVNTGSYGSAAYPSTFDYQPKYFLINGSAYPNGGNIGVNLGENTVFRFVNAGLKNRVPTLQGLYMTLLAEDGFAYPETMEQYSVLLPPAKTIDALINVGAEGTYALYDRSLGLTNSKATGGGMLTYIQTGVFSGPVARDDSYSMAEDGVLVADGVAPNLDGVLANDTTTPPASAALAGNVSAGSLAFNPDGTFTYTPNLNFNGTDLFTYTASDVNGVSNLATVRITVTPVNDPPVAVGNAYTAPQGGTLTVNAPGVLGNDTDVDGNSLTAALSGAPPAGTLVFNANGSFSYTPAGLQGAVETFQYVANDGTVDSLPATVTITVGAPAANIRPFANDDSASTTKNTPVTFNVTTNDVDPDGSINAATVDLNPSTGVRDITVATQRGGTATVDNLGNVTYTPKRGFRGTDLFTYTVKDNLGATSNTATARINVN